MSTQYLTRVEEPPVPPYHAEEMAQGLYGALAWFLAPLLMELDARIDKRLVRTLVQTVRVILTFRDRVNGLLRSRMGGYLDTPDKAPAGTKRLSRRLALCQMVRRTDLAVSRASSYASAGGLERGRAGGGFPSGMSVCGKSRKALPPKSLARCVRAKPPGSRASKRATTASHAVPFLCRG
jgi:hypothetical protein